MEKSISLLKFLRELANEKYKTIDNVNSLSFYKFFDEFPKNSPYISISNNASEFYFRIKRPFSSKTAEDRRIQEIYREFLNLYYSVQNEIEESELLIGNGILYANNLPDVYYPIFTKKANINLNAKKEIIEITPSNAPSRLNVKLISKVDNISPLELKRAADEVSQNFSDPLISEESAKFLKGVAKRLNSNGNVVSYKDIEFYKGDFAFIERNLFLLAPKFKREVEIYDTAISEAQNGKSNFIIDAISGEKNIVRKSGEALNIDPLFTMEYNSEQEQILKNSYENPVTLVDGPPGSGKTHTVVNMIGHFLAEGKRVLILSKKKRALRVIKNMLDPGLNGLVISRINDSNEDINESLIHINDFILNHTTAEMAAKAEKIEKERNDLITRMADTKKNVVDILESESREIVLGDEKIAPVDAARFVSLHFDLIQLIPGEVSPLSEFPLTDDELDYIYVTNKEITATEEQILRKNIPRPDEVLTPEDLSQTFSKIEEIEFSLLKYLPLCPDGTKLIDNGVQCAGNVITDMPEISDLKERLAYLKNYVNLPIYKENALKASLGLIDKKEFDELSKRALALDSFRNKHIDIISGKTLEMPEMATNDIVENLQELESIYRKKDRPGTFDTLFKKNLKNVIANIRINGEPIRSAKDANDAIVLVNYNRLLNDLKISYDELIASKGGPGFENYFRNKDEIFQELDELYIFSDFYRPLIADLNNVLPAHVINRIAPVEKNPTNEILSYLSNDISNLLTLSYIYINELLPLKKKIDDLKYELNHYIDDDIAIISEFINDINSKNMAKYASDYEDFAELSRKKNIVEKREKILRKLNVAPTWKEFIEKRFGVHGLSVVPSEIKTAYKAKVLDKEISRIINNPYEKMRKMLSWYKKSILKSTRDYANTLAWYHFMSKMDENPEIRQSIKGLELTYKKIGKGTGSDAKELSKKAEELLAKCSEFVPCSVMTIDDAIENVVFKNKFDVSVIDEASQADILSLPVLYTANRIIAIGDDKQTTPLYGNIPQDRVKNLRKTMLSSDFPNYHLMDLTTSFYDILKTTFPSSLLSEQFRSVADIIEFVNDLSYDGKILPLRDENDTILKPALNLINLTAEMDGNINIAEAEKTIELVKTIIADKKFAGKTVGIISLHGDEQTKFINDKLLDLIDSIEYFNRKIMCGTPIDFQGDERDVMIINTVDAPNADHSPLRLYSEGGDDINKKRYNVAFSRARDMEFLITSLEEKDLKTGDLRLKAIEYFKDKKEKITAKKAVLTPFEQDIKVELEKNGFEVSTSHTAGKTPIPLVVLNPKVAIETNGDKTGVKRGEIEEKIEKSLQLERVGWKLAHIRETKFTYKKDEAMSELIQNILNKR